MKPLEILKEKLSVVAPTLTLCENEMMSRHTTFRIGGPVSLMALPVNGEELAAALRAAEECGIQPFFLGNGSNLLVADEGADIFVLKSVEGLGKMRIDGERITAESGVLMSRLANFAKENGLTGLEFAHGIPGSVGGGVCMNAGAYGGEMSQVINKVTCVTKTGELLELDGADCEFSYRHSVFSDGSMMVLSAEFLLRKGDPKEISAVMEELAARRREKQPLEYPSAGSAFKRPTGHYAAALIEQCGLKGLRVGGAQVSEKHSGFIINRGGATCADVLALMEEVKTQVYAKSGVMLEPEVKFIGV